MENKARPTFLTVLCILTFIASAWTIYSGISSYMSADSVAGILQSGMEEARDKIDEAKEGSATAESILNSVTDAMSPEKIKNSAIGSIISSILCAIGAFLMWNLNKKGFWIYIAGTVAAVILPVLIYGGFVGLTAGGFGAFFGILFCVLYGLNLKAMS